MTVLTTGAVKKDIKSKRKFYNHFHHILRPFYCPNKKARAPQKCRNLTIAGTPIWQ